MLFKISKGLKANLPQEKTAGFCWYTIDDSLFYIDYEDENGALQRKALNANDAETLTGASLSTILNSSDVEIPTSKAVFDALSAHNHNDIYYTKEELEELSYDVAFINTEDNETVENPDVESGSVVVDSALSTTSTNPVQNKVIAQELNSLSEAIAEKDNAEQDTALLGGELVTESGWTLGTGWSGNVTAGFTHASGNTAPLTFTPSITAGRLYQVTFKSDIAMTTSNLFVQVGNSTQFNLYGDKLDDGTISIGTLAVDASGLVFTPESTFTGTLTGISLREITGSYEAVQQYFDTNDAVTLEIHVTPRGLENVFIGRAVGEMNTSGRANVGIGTDALAKNTSGFWNSAIGIRCLQNNIGGSRNIAIGYQSLMNNIVGQRNIAIGTFTMTKMQAGNWNIAIGADSMNESTGGDKNTAVGFNTLTHNKTDNNVAMGSDVLAQNTTGGNNTAVGTRAMTANVSGKENVAIGSGVLQKCTTGSWNTAIGNAALYNLTTGQKNVAIGMSAGKSLTTGKRCIAIGAEANLEASVDDQLNIGNLLKGSLASGSAYLLLNGGFRLPGIPAAYSGNDTEVWNNGGVLMVGNGGMDTIVQAVIAALPVYEGEVE